MLEIGFKETGRFWGLMENENSVNTERLKMRVLICFCMLPSKFIEIILEITLSQVIEISVINSSAAIQVRNHIHLPLWLNLQTNCITNMYFRRLIIRRKTCGTTTTCSFRRSLSEQGTGRLPETAVDWGVITPLRDLANTCLHNLGIHCMFG